MKNEKEKSNLSGLKGTDRRKFLQMSGLALAGSGLILAGCSDDDDFGKRDQVVLATTVALEDTGISAYNGAGNLIDVDAENVGRICSWPPPTPKQLRLFKPHRFRCWNLP